ncbi:MAG TPA: phosphotransferase [Burkholderiales bacterium]|nr:phosphotransferase [Burkholderiales bacterium]
MADNRFNQDIFLAPASADASFRRYFRVMANGKTWIAMDAPPPQEDCRPFVKVAALMHDAGLNVPQVIAQDIERGFLLLSDLGATTYLNGFTEGNTDALFSDAIDALILWQRASRPEVLPPYDRALLQREIDLFPEWYVGKHLRTAFTSAQQQAFAAVSKLLIDAALAQPAVYVHRDYMPRNLMLSTPNPGVLDFQDAVYGAISYDVASLFRDAFVSWPEERELDWVIRYWERAKTAGLPVPADFATFWRDFEWMGLQRHIKVLGIFARINYRDGKPHYLTDTPRFINYARKVSARYRELAPLARLLDELEGRAHSIGYTF